MWSTVSARSGALRKAVHGTGPLPKLQVDALLSPVGCEIEPRPIISTNARSAERCSTCAIKPKCWRMFTTRRLKYARIRGHKARCIRVKSKAHGKPSANLRMLPRENPHRTLGGACCETAVILLGSEPGTKKEPALCREREPAL
jgi:hypothetical protein